MLRDYGQPEKDLPEIGDIIFGDPYWRRLDKGEVSLAETTKHFVETYPKYSQCLAYFSHMLNLWPWTDLEFGRK